MDQKKTGEFLKSLRKEKGMTQEQLAERFCVSSRTVSRWETGSNMPDLGMLIDLAEFYHVDIRELMDGEKKGGKMDTQSRETLEKVAVYTAQKEKWTQAKTATVALIMLIALYGGTVLFGNGTPGLLYGIVPEAICDFLFTGVYLSAAALLIAYLRVRCFLEKPAKEPERSVTATVLAKEVRKGTHQSGRSLMGYSFVVHFQTEDGKHLELYAYEMEFGSLKEGIKGTLTYQGRYFCRFTP